MKNGASCEKDTLHNCIKRSKAIYNEVTLPLSNYIHSLRENRVLGVAETSSYGALQALLDEIGATLKPPVRCILHPSGNGRAIERDWTNEERAALQAGAASLGLDLDAMLLHLGETAFDVYLNDVAYWSGVPARVWTYTMGGYRVFKKWLSYREAAVLRRDLKPQEARETRAIVRRIAALLLLEPQLNANYAACSAATVPINNSASQS